MCCVVEYLITVAMMLQISTIICLVLVLVRGEVIVITSAEENTIPVFEVYDVAEDAVITVEKVMPVVMIIQDEDGLCRWWGREGQGCYQPQGQQDSWRRICWCSTRLVL